MRTVCRRCSRERRRGPGERNECQDSGGEAHGVVIGNVSPVDRGAGCIGGGPGPARSLVARRGDHVHLMPGRDPPPCHFVGSRPAWHLRSVEVLMQINDSQRVTFGFLCLISYCWMVVRPTALYLRQDDLRGPEDLPGRGLRAVPAGPSSQLTMSRLTGLSTMCVFVAFLPYLIRLAGSSG